MIDEKHANREVVACVNDHEAAWLQGLTPVSCPKSDKNTTDV